MNDRTQTDADTVKILKDRNSDFFTFFQDLVKEDKHDDAIAHSQAMFGSEAAYMTLLRIHKKVNPCPLMAQ